MINLKDPEDQVSSLVSVASIAAMLITLAYLIFTLWKPGETTADIDRAAAKKQSKTRFDMKLAEKKLDESTAEIDALTWDDLPENIYPVALRQVTAFAQSRGVKLNAFRPQRQDSADDLDTLPIMLTVEGPFISVLEFERDIDVPKNRLAISQVQMSSADPNTDRVTANIGIVAYLRPPTTTVQSSTPSTAPNIAPAKNLSNTNKEKNSHA